MVDASVLVVDDSLVVHKLIEMNLQRMGIENIVTARDGMEGLRQLTEGAFDVAFVDVNMPVMDGLTMLRLYQEDPSSPKTPIVIVTTEGEETTGVDAMQLGASGYITKPVDAKTLREVATELIEKGRGT